MTDDKPTRPRPQPQPQPQPQVEPERQPQAYAVWYFVAATFVFASPTIFFQGRTDVWLTVLTLTIGGILVIFGGVQFGREMKARRPGRGTDHGSR